jgi:hypothetical protein
VAKYPFLSDEWVVEARRLHAEAEQAVRPGEVASATSVRVNLVVTEAPFQPCAIDAHVDTSTGYLEIDTGHLADPDVTVSMAYETARSLFVAGDVQALMQAFLAGRIKVDGDLSKLLDPRSGMWPGTMAAAPPPRGPESWGGPAIGGGQGAASGGGPGGERPGQQRPGFPGLAALQLVNRLQEITE